MSPKILFSAGILLVLSGLLSPPLALAAGIAFGMLMINPFESASRHWSKLLLQFSVVALGFGMNFGDVMRAGRAGFGYTALGVCVALALGLALGRSLGVRSKAAFLITAGTAICGGSAIAAIAPITNPDEEELAMSMGTVFTLNAIALFLFPAVGLALHLTQTQFGIWSAIAIHDTSSVVGAAAKYGSKALEVGTVVKLTRALWIIPLTFVAAVLTKSESRLKIPWFIPLFFLAALAKSTFTALAPVFAAISHLGHTGLALTLFLIGSGMNVQMVKRAGPRVMALGVLLWVVVAALSLAGIKFGWIHM